MAVTVADNILIFTGTTTLAKGTFGPRLRAKSIQWEATGATPGTSRARIDDQSGGNTLWAKVAEAANVNEFDHVDGGLEFRAAESAAAAGGLTVVVDVGTLRIEMGGGNYAP